MGKLIDLDTAIDAVKVMEDKSGKGEIAGFYNVILERVIDKLNDLPSAQPEWNNHAVACLLAELLTIHALATTMALMNGCPKNAK